MLPEPSALPSGASSTRWTSKRFYDSSPTATRAPMPSPWTRSAVASARRAGRATSPAPAPAGTSRGGQDGSVECDCCGTHWSLVEGRWAAVVGPGLRTIDGSGRVREGARIDGSSFMMETLHPPAVSPPSPTRQDGCGRRLPSGRERPRRTPKRRDSRGPATRRARRSAGWCSRTSASTSSCARRSARSLPSSPSASRTSPSSSRAGPPIAASSASTKAPRRPRSRLRYRYPDRITIYTDEICEHARSTSEAERQVRRTVLHEIGHYFGINDTRLRELGW